MLIIAERINVSRKQIARTICGLTNVSYGLPARKPVNRAFLAAAITMGLDSSIIDPTNELLLCDAEGRHARRRQGRLLHGLQSRLSRRSSRIAGRVNSVPVYEADRKGRSIIIACRVMEPELAHVVLEKNGADNRTDILYLEQALHRTPGKLLVKVQEKIDQVARTATRSSWVTASAPKAL